MQAKGLEEGLIECGALADEEVLQWVQVLLRKVQGLPDNSRADDRFLLSASPGSSCDWQARITDGLPHVGHCHKTIGGRGRD